MSSPGNKGPRSAKIAEAMSIWRHNRELGRRRDDLAFDLMGIKATDARCLEALESGPLTATEVARACAIGLSAATTLIDRLERRDLVRRSPDRQDRRRITVERTPAADAARERIYGPVAEWAADSLAQFSDAELAVIIRYLGTGTAVIERHLEHLNTIGGGR